MINLKKELEKLFPLVKNRARVIAILLIFFTLGIAYSRYLKVGIVAIAFIAMAAFSKIYHRIIKTTMGIDLVFFTTVMVALVYRNILLSLVVGWIGLIAADTISSRFSYTSIISLICITIISFAAGLLGGLPLAISAIILMILFEIIAALLYSLMGSSIDKIALFLISHFLFNLFMIISFAESLSALML